MTSPMDFTPNIRATLSKLTSLPSAARAVLITVCELMENGGKGECFASNEYLGERVCCHKRSVSRLLTMLQQRGLMTVEFENNDNARRLLTPTPQVVAAYRSGDTTELLLALKECTPPVKRVYTGCAEGCSPHVKGSTHPVNHTTYTTEQTTDYPVLDTPNVALSTSAGADRAPGVVDLEKELAQVKAELAKANDRLTKAAEVYHTQQQDLETVRQELATTQQDNQSLREQLAKKEKRAKRQPAPFAEEMPTLSDWHPQQRAVLPAEQQQRLVRFFGWAEEHHLPRVFSRNLTPKKVLYLAKEFSMDALLTILLEMENSPAFDDKKSADLTAETWLKREQQRQEQRERQADERRYAHVTTTATAGYNAYARRN